MIKDLPLWAKWAFSFLVFISISSISLNVWFMQKDRMVIEEKFKSIELLLREQGTKVDNYNHQLERLNILICLNYEDRTKLIREGYLKGGVDRKRLK